MTLPENEKFKEELNNKSSKNNGSGRKESFTEDEKNVIYLNYLAGKSMRSIATEYSCSAGLVHKIINERKQSLENSSYFFILTSLTI